MSFLVSRQVRAGGGKSDWVFFCLIVLVLSCGMLALYSAGYSKSLHSSAPFRHQAFSLIVAGAGFLICAIPSADFWRRISPFLYFCSSLTLIAVLASSSGYVAGGARRWLEVGGFRLQPSEFSKLVLVLIMARVLSMEVFSHKGLNFFRLLIPIAILGFPVLLVASQPDLGTALCHVLIAGSIILLAGVQRSTLVCVFFLVLSAIYPAWAFFLKTYQKQRMLTFFSPETDPLGSGYHALQSKIAVGSGGLFGKGYMDGTQTQLRFLPEQTTDFIFSVWAEEWGFFGSSLVLLLYTLLLFRMFRSASSVGDRFSALVIFGVAANVFWQVLVIIGMVTGVMPVVGLTLPLFSFGGSSLIALMAGLGIAFGVSRKRQMFS